MSPPASRRGVRMTGWFGEGEKRALVFGRNSILFTPKLNALPPRTHSFLKNISLRVQGVSIGQEKEKNSGLKTKIVSSI